MANPKPSTGFHTNPERINKKGAPEKSWTWSGLLKKMADEEIDGKTRKRMIAEALHREAKKGNMAAIKEFGNRIDGMPKQGIELGGPDGDKLEIKIIEDTSLKDAHKDQLKDENK